MRCRVHDASLQLETRHRRARTSGLSDMELLLLIPIVAITAVVAAKFARMRATRSESLSRDVTARLEALEHALQSVQQELAETQERLDFAERLLSKAREERRLS